MVRQASVSSIALAAALACLPVQAARSVFVSSTGMDQQVLPFRPGVARATCDLARPCRTFQYAYDVVDPGGEIVALDTADYGPVAIAKSVAIIGNPGIVARISVATGNGVTIAAPFVEVVLRNLNIEGAGGQDGVHMTEGASLTLEHCVVSNFRLTGVAVVSDGGRVTRVRIVGSVMRENFVGAFISGRDVSADIVDSRFMGNGNSGLRVASTSGTASASVSGSVASGNGASGFVATSFSGTARISLIRATASNNGGNGFMTEALGAGASAQMTVSGSMAGSNAGAGFLNSASLGRSVMTVGGSAASGNSTGFLNDAAAGANATFESLGNNIVTENTSGVSVVNGVFVINGVTLISSR